jgi:ParB-like chromosome segregation protein Spo0J
MKQNIDSLKKKFISLSISDIVPYSKNNRKHTKRDIDEIIKSIQKDGYIAPIIVDEENMIIA